MEVVAVAVKSSFLDKTNNKNKYLVLIQFILGELILETGLSATFCEWIDHERYCFTIFIN